MRLASTRLHQQAVERALQLPVVGEDPLVERQRGTVIGGAERRAIRPAALCGILPWVVDGSAESFAARLWIGLVLSLAAFVFAFAFATAPATATAAVAPRPTRAAYAAPPAPPALSPDSSSSIASSYGSGSFGRWGVDAFGLPMYRYTADEQRDPNARQVELDGATRAQHELGNDHIKGMAYNDGYTLLWSQDRLAQWANLYQAQSRHYSGGFGYLNVGGKTLSTLYLDRPVGAQTEREFGVGYYHRRLRADRISIAENVYAPYGNDPVLLHDVTITNRGSRRRRMTWYEYWDVNPYSQTQGAQYNVGLGRPRWNPATRTLAVAEQDAGDRHPLSIFAALLSGPVSGFETSLPEFFGNGTRAAPAEVVTNRVSNSIAPPAGSGEAGDTLFVLRSTVSLVPGQSVRLRYAYGMAHPAQILRLVSRYARAADPFRASELAWAGWLPKADFGFAHRWVARELVWDSYLLRAATVYEEGCGEHTITQGGDYQYAMGENLGFRSWLHYMLPITYSDPELAREILRYAIKLQPPGPARDAQLPYGIGAFCRPVTGLRSNDLDFWLMLGAVEYGLGTRDTAFFGERLPFYGTGESATVWRHIKIAVAHQESLVGPHGLYALPPGFFGDWNDASAQFEHLTESTLVAAQLAYVYPRLAELAGRLGDAPFARQLRRRAHALRAVMRSQWTAGGWYSRGYAGTRQVGKGVIFGEPQPWAILAGIPNTTQAATLVHNIRHFLGGVGEPGGPSRIGSAMIPAYHAPDITERGDSALTAVGADLPDSPVENAAEWPGGSWFDVNGWLTWALGSLDGKLAHAREYAWDEYLRNTLAAHATAFPDAWDGTISADDVCNGYYSSHPQLCGNDLSTEFDGQNTEQPTWMVMDAIRLAGVTPTESGFQIAPSLPLRRFSLRLPDIGVASAPGLLRGYVRVHQSGKVTMTVTLPAVARRSAVAAFAGGRRVKATIRGSAVVFALPAVAGRVADWAVERLP